jgi:Predicted transcriptional regulators
MVVARRDINAAHESLVIDREHLKKLLADHDLNYSKLAAEIGVNRLTIARWIDGTVTPGLAAAKALASRLDTTVEALWPSPKKDKR